MLRLSFTDAEMERESVRDRYDLLLGVIATLVIEAAGTIVYREVMFPVVELRAQLARWLEAGIGGREPFRFRSLESEDPDLITLTPAVGGWNVAARHQTDAFDDVLPDGEVREACEAYVASVDEWVRDNLAIDVGSYV